MVSWQILDMIQQLFCQLDSFYFMAGLISCRKMKFFIKTKPLDKHVGLASQHTTKQCKGKSKLTPILQHPPYSPHLTTCDVFMKHGAHIRDKCIQHFRKYKVKGLLKGHNHR
jgi:hypothetical protein